MLRSFWIIAGTLIASLVAANAGYAQDVKADAPQWEAGKNYFLIDPPQPTNSGGKVEVIEVFSYGCPACNQAYPFVDKIKKSLPATATFGFVPAAFNPSEDWPLFQRAYYTAQALGIAEQSHDAMFDAVWKTRTLSTMEEGTNRLKQPLPSLDDVAKFYVQYGVKPEDFIATANSFAINTKMKRADAFIKACEVESTPTIIVNGKYRLNAKSVGGGWDKVGQLVQFLIQKETSGK